MLIIPIFPLATLDLNKMRTFLISYAEPGYNFFVNILYKFHFILYKIDFIKNLDVFDSLMIGCIRITPDDVYDTKYMRKKPRAQTERNKLPLHVYNENDRMVGSYGRMLNLDFIFPEYEFRDKEYEYMVEDVGNKLILEMHQLYQVKKFPVKLVDQFLLEYRSEIARVKLKLLEENNS
jgi:hypothetical protein